MVATRRESQAIHYSIADPRLHDMMDALFASNVKGMRARWVYEPTGYVARTGTILTTVKSSGFRGPRYYRSRSAKIVTHLNTLCDHIEKGVNIIQKGCNARTADAVADEASVAIAGHKSAIQKTSEMVGNVWLR